MDNAGIERSNRQRSDRLVGAEQNLDPSIAHEQRIIECAASYLVIRYARLHQRGPNGTHASGTQALKARVRGAIDSDLERRILGEVHRDLRDGASVRCLNIRRAVIETESTVWGPAIDGANEAMSAGRSAGPLHARLSGGARRTGATGRHRAARACLPADPLGPRIAGIADGSGWANQGRALGAPLSGQALWTDRSGRTRRARGTSDTRPLSADLSGRALRASGSGRAGRPTRTDHDRAFGSHRSRRTLRARRTGWARNAGGTRRAVAGSSGLPDRSLRPGRPLRPGEPGGADQTRGRRVGRLVGGWRRAARRSRYRECHQKKGAFHRTTSVWG